MEMVPPIIVLCKYTFQGEKELQVSLLQSLVLLLFNSADKLPFTHIKEVTQIGRLP